MTCVTLSLTTSAVRARPEPSGPGVRHAEAGDRVGAQAAPEAPSREQLLAALSIANDAAKDIRDPRSPAAKAAHEDINALLDRIVGA